MQSPLELFRAAPVQHLDVGSTTLAYRVFGSGPALVLVHGWPMSGVTFRCLVAELRHHFTCYVPDLPGAGDSPWDPSLRDLFFDAGRLVAEFADRLGLEQFAMMGFDSGGAVARIAASQRPGRVFALVMTNTEVPGHRLPLLEQFKMLAGLPGATTVFRWLLHSKTFLRSKYGFKGAFVDLAQLDGDFKEATLEPLRRDPSGMLRSLLNADLDISDHLAAVHEKIDAPLLAVWGDKCGFFPLREGTAMVRDWPGDARLEVVPGQKLMLHEEDPQSVLRVMIPFLREHAPPTLMEANAG